MSEQVPSYRQSAWSEDTFARWWRSMGEVFGRPWFEQFGDKPSDAWMAELGKWSYAQAGEVIQHLVREGRSFPPNLSEVVSIAEAYRERGRASAGKHAKPDDYAVEREFKKNLRNIELDIKRFQHEYPGATKREACLNYMRRIGVLQSFKEILPTLADDEARAEREAIQAESNGR